MQTKHLAVSVEKTLVLFRRRTVLLRKYFRVYLGVRTCCIFSLFLQLVLGCSYCL